MGIAERLRLVHVEPAAEIGVDLIAGTVVIVWTFGGSVCVFMSAGWFEVDRSVAKQGTATNSDIRRREERSAVPEGSV